MADESQVLVKMRLLGAAAMARDVNKGSRSIDRFGSAGRRASASTAALGSSVGRAGRGISRFAKFAAYGGVVLLGGLALGLKSTTAGFMESETVAAQTEATLKSTGRAARVTAKDIGALATEISRYSGRDDEAVQASANLLLTFTKIRREGKGVNDIFGRATRATADLSQTFHKDLNSSAVMLGKALNDPIKGITALGRSGIQFSARQRETIKTLVESGKILDAQKIILAEVETQVGGSARAYGRTLPGALDRAKVAVGNLSEIVGSVFAPILKGGANALFNFADRIEPTFDRVAKAIGRANPGEKIWAFISMAMDGIGAAIERVPWGTLLAGARRSIDWIGEQAPKVVAMVQRFIARLPAIAKVAQGVINDVVEALRPAMPFIQNVVLPLLKGIGIGVLGGLVAAFQLAIPIIRVVATVLGAIGRAAAPLSGVLEKIGLVIGFVFGPGAVAKVAKFLVMGSKLGPVIGKVAQVLAFAAGKARAFGRGTVSVGRGIVSVAGAVNRGLVWLRRYIGFLGGLPGRIGRIAVNMVGSFVNGVAALPGAAVRAGRAVVSGISRLIGGLPGRAYAWMSGLAKNLSSGAVLTALGNAARRIGKAIVDGIVKLIRDSPGAIASAISSIVPGPVRSAIGIGAGAASRVAGALNPFDGNASGGLIGNRMSWVGERGPELARFPVGTRIFPAGQSQNMARSRAAAPLASAGGAPLYAELVVNLDGSPLHRGVYRVERAREERR